MWNDKTFTDYKREIPLSQFIQDQGYSSHTPWAKAKSSHAAPCFENAQGDRVYLFSSGGGEKYFDIGRGKSGDLIDFIRDRLSGLFAPAAVGAKNELSAIFRVLKAHQGEGGVRPPMHAPVKPLEKHALGAERKFNRSLFELSPLTERTYLYAQGITDKTLDSPEFSGQVLNVRNPRMTDGKLDGHYPQVSVAFPLSRAPGGEMVGLEERNTHFKGYGLTSESGTGVWMSNLLPGTQRIHIFESAKDALSFHQLYHPPKALYISTGGNVAGGQLQTIGRLSEQLKSPEVKLILSFDNDVAGAAFDTAFILHWSRATFPDLRRIPVPEDQPYSYTFGALSSERAEEAFHSLRHTLSTSEDMAQKAGSLFHFGVQDHQRTLSIARTQAALRAFTGAVLAACKLDEKIYLQKAQLKDHNEDLKQKLGIPLVQKAQKVSSLKR